MLEIAWAISVTDTRIFYWIAGFAAFIGLALFAAFQSDHRTSKKPLKPAVQPEKPDPFA